MVCILHSTCTARHGTSSPSIGPEATGNLSNSVPPPKKKKKKKHKNWPFVRLYLLKCDCN